MRIVALIFGAVLILVAVRDTYEDSASGSGDGQGLWPLLKKDFEPGAQGNFLAWFAAILLIGMLGYAEPLKPVANSMLALLILVLFLSNGGFFAKLKEAVSQKP